jgi:hypothetical protein
MLALTARPNRYSSFLFLLLLLPTGSLVCVTCEIRGLFSFPAWDRKQELPLESPHRSRNLLKTHEPLGIPSRNESFFARAR